MVSNLKGGPGDINEVRTVLPVCETSDVAAQKAILEAMTPIAEKFIAETDAQGEETIVADSGFFGILAGWRS